MRATAVWLLSLAGLLAAQEPFMLGGGPFPEGFEMRWTVDRGKAELFFAGRAVVPLGCTLAWLDGHARLGGVDAKARRVYSDGENLALRELYDGFAGFSTVEGCDRWLLCGLGRPAAPRLLLLVANSRSGEGWLRVGVRGPVLRFRALPESFDDKALVGLAALLEGLEALPLENIDWLHVGPRALAAGSAERLCFLLQAPWDGLAPRLREAALLRPGVFELSLAGWQSLARAADPELVDLHQPHGLEQLSAWLSFGFAADAGSGFSQQDPFLFMLGDAP